MQFLIETLLLCLKSLPKPLSVKIDNFPSSSLFEFAIVEGEKHLSTQCCSLKSIGRMEFIPWVPVPKDESCTKSFHIPNRLL